MSTLKKKEQSEAKIKRHCYLCGEEFQSHTHYDRFCQLCKEHNELLKYAGVFPSFDEEAPSTLFN